MVRLSFLCVAGLVSRGAVKEEEEMEEEEEEE
jgi:hypothetical protein